MLIGGFCMRYEQKAVIEKAAPRKLIAGARGRYRVKCLCGRMNMFDAFSWAGHGALKCKGCKRFISQSGVIADSRSELK